MQVSAPVWVCFHDVTPLREELEYAVREAAGRERAAWSELERASRSDADEDADLRWVFARWQAASRSLIAALRALKR